jgi:hypothetical protein
MRDSEAAVLPNLIARLAALIAPTLTLSSLSTELGEVVDGRLLLGDSTGLDTTTGFGERGDVLGLR